MNKMRVVFYLLMAFFYILCSSEVLAQIEPDDLLNDEDSLLLIGRVQVDSLQIDEVEDVVEVEMLDLNNMPSSTIYSCWNNEHIRVQRTDVRSIKDTMLVLVNDSQKFVFPYKGKLISTFGPRGRRNHAGVDIKLGRGDPVVSAFDGVVRVARTYSGYGKLVVVRHYNGLETVYSHLSKISVKLNQEVKAGDLVGLGGRTGRATTDHLHFETRFKGEVFHPCHILNFDNYDLVSDTLFISRHTFKISKTPVKSNRNIVQELSDNEVIAEESDEIAGEKPEPITKSDVSDSKPKYHIIKSGDTLYKLSLKYRISVSKLCEINKIKDTEILRIGQKIYLN